MFKKLIISLNFITLFFSFAFCAIAADVIRDEGFGTNLNTIATESEYSKITDPQESLSLYMGGLIAWVGMLGIFILIQIFLAAYEYMTAQGNEEKVIAARKRIKNVVIAAIILVGGYLIVSIIIKWTTAFTGYGQ